MDNLVSFLSKILILSLVSLLLITSSDVIFTKHDRQENKIITSLKLLCELFIVFTTLLYIGSKSTEKTNNCHENIVLLLSILFTLFVFNNSHIKEKKEYIIKGNKETFSTPNRFRPMKFKKFEKIEYSLDNKNNKNSESKVNNDDDYISKGGLYHKMFNKSWRGINNKEYIFDQNTKKYFNELRKPDEYDDLYKSTQQKDYSGPFKKFAAEHHLSDDALTKSSYNISDLYNNKVDGNFTKIDKVLEILNRPDSNNGTSGPITINDIVEGSIIRIELENYDGLTEDTEDIVRVIGVYGDKIEYVSDMEYYNIKQFNDNGTNEINNSNNNNDNSNNNANNINNPDNL